MDSAVIYACSHRAGGNSLRAAQEVAEGIADVGGTAEIIELRKHSVLPCLACGKCGDPDTGAHPCVLRAKDDAEALFAPMLTAPTVIFASPIYFYHLPSAFKTWMDRAQSHWVARAANEGHCPGKERLYHNVLVAARPRGQKLFEGAELSLKYFAWSFCLKPGETLGILGKDGPREMGDHKEDLARCRQLGRDAWRAI